MTTTYTFATDVIIQAIEKMGGRVYSVTIPNGRNETGVVIPEEAMERDEAQVLVEALQVANTAIQGGRCFLSCHKA